MLLSFDMVADILMNLYRPKQILFGLVTGVAVALATWLLESTSLFMNFEWVETVVVIFSFPAVVLSMIASGRGHGPPITLTCFFTFLVWFCIGYLLSVAIFRRS